MKTKGLTRLDIFKGMSEGVFQEFDEFVRDDGEQMIIIKQQDDLALYWDTGDGKGNPVQIRIVWEEEFKMIEKVKFNIGDWIMDSSMYGHETFAEITRIETLDKYTRYFLEDENGKQFCSFLTAESVRKATDEEIATEKKHRFWNKLNRKVDQYKVGDIVIGTVNDLMEVVESDVHDGLIKCGQFHPHHQHFDYFNISKENVSLIVPVEQRLDMKGCM